MSYQDIKDKVFKRYNYAVALVFIVITLLVLAISFVHYQSELEYVQVKSFNALKKQANALNTILEQSVQAITAMQEFANNSLAYPEELAAKLPKLSQDKRLFYLDNPRRDVTLLDEVLSNNITGLGDINDFSQDKTNEIIMANALTPAFMSAKLTLPVTTWFYYLSLHQFINIYPWIHRQTWQYRDTLLEMKYIQTIINSTTSEASHFWSLPYLDTAGTGLNLSLGTRVFQQGKMAGAVIIDISLAKLQDTLPLFSSAEDGVILLNKDNRILVYKGVASTTLSPETLWQDLLPVQLSKYKMQELLTASDSQQLDGWLLQYYKLPINGWTLIKYQNNDDFFAPVNRRFYLTLTLYFSGLVAFLLLVYLLTRRTFIGPATDFMSHIENCAQGNPGKVKPSPDWLPWFNIVENIFGQNRSLLQQLKDKNKELDKRVTEKTEALLKRSQQHRRDYALLRSVMNAMPELIIFNDDKDQLIGCNRAFEDLVNRTEAVMLGTKVNMLMPKSLGNALTELSALSMKSAGLSPEQTQDIPLNQDSQAISHQIVVATPTQTYEVVSREFYNETGTSLGTINIFRDVTKQYDSQSALEKAKNQAECANEAKIEFLANMSHEIRTPINAIRGMMILLEQTALNTRQLHYLANATDASTSLLYLVNELLDLSKIEAGKMFITQYEANLDVIIDKALKFNLGMVANGNLTLVVDIAPDVPEVVITDELRLVQVLTNLLNNAVKFTVQGEIKLTVEVTAKSATSAMVSFSVKDKGIGVAKEKQQHLFDTFSQADESITREYGGSGLGLSICQQIVNLLGGEITLVSELGEGSTFSFALPFTLPTINTDTTKTHPTIFKDIMLCTLGFELSSNLVSSLKQFQWQYCQLTCVSESVEFTQNKQVILLIQETLISSKDISYLKQLTTQTRHGVILLGLCQVTGNSVSPKMGALLNELAMPYVLLDMPLYRFSIGALSKALLNKKKSAPYVNITRDSADLALNSASEKMPLMSPTTVQINQGNNLSGYTILLVEDNLLNQLVAKELLVNLKAEVIIAENGQIALDILAAQASGLDGSQSIDVVLMDIQMPVMDGLTATRLIRQQPRYSTLPIIAMTAHTREEDKDRCYAAGMNLHIAKPISVNDLLNNIQSVLVKVVDP